MASALDPIHTLTECGCLLEILRILERIKARREPVASIDSRENAEKGGAFEIGRIVNTR